jgi:protein-S-isoprenylcysteine O-methyltransferase Ste14
VDRSYLADRLLPALVFAGAAGARAACLVGDATRPTGGAGAHWLLVRGLSLGGDVLACLFCALLAVLLLDRRPVRGGGAGPAGIGVALAGTLLMNALLAQPVAGHDWRVLIVGDGLMLAGLALAIWAAVSLGGCFGVAPEARGLVRRGAYRFVRHPMYLGEAIAGLGALLAVLAPWTVAVYAGFCACQLARARLEERALTSAFPAYAAYRRRTPLLPRRSGENEQAALAAGDHQHDQEDHDAQQQQGAAARPAPAARVPENHAVTSLSRPA